MDMPRPSDRVSGTDVFAPEPGPTVLDVVENCLGELPSEGRAAILSKQEIRELHGQLSEHYLAAIPPPARVDEARLFIAGVGDESSHRADQLSMLLYADSLVLYDPLEVALEAHVRGLAEPSSSRYELSWAFERLSEFAPLIRRGTIVLAPRFATAFEDDDIDAVAAAVIGDPYTYMVDVWEDQRDPYGGGPMRYTRGPASHWLTAAGHNAVCYEPDDEPGSGIQRLWERAQERALVGLSHRGVDARLFRALAVVELPWFPAPDVATLVRVRQQEEAFAEWRTALRQAARFLPDRASPTFSEEAREILEETLLPVALRVSRGSWRSRVRDLSVGIPLSLGGALAAASLSGADPAASAAGAATGQVTSALAQALLGVTESPSDSVARLLLRSPGRPAS